ncbi:hypothetical protein R6Q57_021591 [Mikania cordata]
MAWKHPGNSKNRYLGIWFANSLSPAVAWVANRETPLTDTSGVLKLDNQGSLNLVNGSGRVIWSSNSSASSGANINLVAQLLDTGNLVIKNGNEALIWQSFDYPGDTYLPGMKAGKNFITGRETYLTSWRSAEDPSPDPDSSFHKKKVVVIVTLSISAMLTFILSLYVRRKWKNRSDAERSSQMGSAEVPLFSLSKISRATNDFSVSNKLGEGGFGPVYKGVLEEGQEIAVKRLSKTSQQGLNEFKNEVICIAKLQHRNLVKLIGYCIQGDDKMLIYEYMSNSSLDSFLFDDSRRSLLDWPQRFQIIQGIARGLLYLHQDSRLKVVHRDLKAGNILLDHLMHPKISDFGLARMFKEDESEAKTKRVVGTLGYISPEYATNGVYSVKSDIFSFGVLVLEIISGKKNRGFVHEDHDDNLLGHAWRLYKEGKSLNLIDECISASYSAYEVLRSVHVGLLCVQQRVEDRPNTPTVVGMLSGEGSLPSPKKPAFFIQDSEINSISILPLLSSSSMNEVTLSQVDCR